MSRLKSFLTTSACALALATSANAGSFDIPAGDLKTALDIYARQSGAELAISGEAVRGARTKGVKGNLPADEALTRILSGTGFKARDIDGSLIIVPNKQSNIEIQSLQLAQANPSSGRIEEVLVTARKREEAVENIPISITALSAADLKTFGVRNFADLEGVVPGLNLGGGGNGVKRDSSPFIRGVGQRETKVTLDSAVATYIDGVYIGRAAGAMLDVVDVENIQVLRGPQGTLFGRNATGGALAVTLKKPNNNWEGNVSANVGNYGRRDISGTINVPFIEDMLMGRLTISSANSNGFFTNVVDNTKWGGDNRITGIAQLRYLPTDRITIDILGERTRIRETPRPQRCAYVRPAGTFTTIHLTVINGGPANNVDGFPRYEGLCKRSEALKPSQFASDQSVSPDAVMGPGRYWVDTTTGAVTANWDMGNLAFLSDLNLKSISAYRKTKQIADEDLDAVSAPYIIRVQDGFDETTQWSQELTLSGKAFHDRLFFNTGFYYFKEKTPKNDLVISAGISPSIFNSITNEYSTTFAEAAKERLETDNYSWAWYGQADFDVTPEVQLTAGVRYTKEVRWSRYSKVYADWNSMTNGTLVDAADLSGLKLLRSTQPGATPVTSWTYSGKRWFMLDPAGVWPSPIDYELVPGLFNGDEMSFSNQAWTPMASLKYKANERLLQKLRLDQAMLYATYSVGFHSGGVTSGAIDYGAPVGAKDASGLSLPFNNPAVTGIPCPVNYGLGTTTCPRINALPAPGFGTSDPIPYYPEKLTNYEVGFKLTGLDRRIQANLSAFYMQYTDMQTTAVGTRFGIPVPYIENVGKSVIKGFEAEVTAMPTPQWRIVMNGSYTDADIKEWLSLVTPLLSDATQDLTRPTYLMDRSDERMPRVPRWQLFGSTEYNFNLGSGGTLTPSVGVRFTSSIYHGFDRGSWIYSYGGNYYNHNGDVPPTRIPSASFCTRAVPHATCNWNGGPTADPLITPNANAKWKTTSRPTAFFDARVNWNSEDGRLEAALWGKNLFNKDDYLVGGIPLADVLGAVGQVYANPRTFGLTFTYHFGE